MKQRILLCKNPEIYNDKPQFGMWLRGLRHIGCAEYSDGIYTINWEKAKQSNIAIAPNVSTKGIAQILAWAQSAQHRVQSDAATPSQAGATCPHCGLPILLVAPETPRR